MLNYSLRVRVNHYMKENSAMNGLLSARAFAWRAFFVLLITTFTAFTVFSIFVIVTIIPISPGLTWDVWLPGQIETLGGFDLSVG